MTSKPTAEQMVDRQQLVRILGCSLRSVADLEAAGVIHAARPGRGGRPSLYDLTTTVAAYIERERQLAAKAGQAIDATRERAQKDRAQRLLMEQTLAARARELLPRHEVEKTWTSEAAAIRAHLLAWPASLTDQVHRAAITEGLPGVERVLDAAVRTVLRELAAGRHAVHTSGVQTGARKKKPAS